MKSIVEVKSDVRALIFTSAKERVALGLPSIEAEVMKKLAETVWEHLQERGRAFNCGGLGYLLLEDHVPIAVRQDGNEFARLLQRDYDLMPGASQKDFVGKHIGMMCNMVGETVELRLTSHYDAITGTVYLSSRRGQLVKITAHCIEEVPNGADNQVFLYPKDYQEIDLMRVTPSGWEDDPLYLSSEIDKLLFGGVHFKESVMTQDDKKKLFTLYLIGLWMNGVVREKVLFTVLGPTGSGKTFMLRVVGKLLQGDKFDVSNALFGAKEIENAMVNNPFVVFDEFTSPNREIRSLLKQAVTGGQMKRRELYTTANEVTMPYRSALAFSTVDQPFDNEEETNRQLAFFLDERTPGTYISEDELMNEIRAQRPKFFAQMTNCIQLVLRALEQDREVHRVSMRLASYAALLIKIMKYVDADSGEEKARDILGRWQEEQEDSAFANNDLADALRAWTDTLGFNHGEKLTPAELWSKLVPSFTSGKPWWAESGKHLSSALRRSQGVYGREFGMKIEFNKSKRYNTYSFDPPKKDESLLYDAGNPKMF